MKWRKNGTDHDYGVRPARDGNGYAWAVRRHGRLVASGWMPEEGFAWDMGRIVSNEYGDYLWDYSA